MSEQGNDNSNGAPRRVKFDPTINLGHVLTAGMFLVSTIAAWVTLDARVSQTARDLVRVEGEANRVAVRVENVLTEKITAVQANMNQTQIRTAEDVREIKLLMRDGFRDLDAKLERKVDKPSR